MLRHPAGHASLPSDWQLTENYREIRRYTTCALPRYLFNFWKLNSKLIFIPPLSLQYERLLLMESPIARGTWVLPLHIEHEFFPHWLIIPLLWAALRRIKPSAGMNFAQYAFFSERDQVQLGTRAGQQPSWRRRPRVPVDPRGCCWWVATPCQTPCQTPWTQDPT